MLSRFFGWLVSAETGCFFLARFSILRKFFRSLKGKKQTEAEGYVATSLKFDLPSIVERLKKGLHSPPSWLFSIKLAENHGNEVVLETENQFQADWIDKNYLSLIRKESKEVHGHDLFRIRIVPRKEKPAGKGNGKKNYHSQNSFARDVHPENAGLIDPGKTFDNFVVGPSNQFAYAAATAITENPGRAYNPLFIYGGVGLGKTHILHSIGNQLLKNKKVEAKKLFCYSAERFTNEVIRGIRNKSMEEFRNKYRYTCDVILIDDIQFIAGKESTQEEFFHTFEDLRQRKAQVVMTSDKPPSSMTHFDERLKSRFEWGLTADIQVPETETKIAIIEKRSAAENVDIPSEVASLVAKSVANVRELEGALNKIIAHSKMFGRKISLDTTKTLLKDLSKRVQPRIITIEMIQKEVSDFFDLTVKELKSDQKQKRVSQPRQIAMYLSRKYTTSSFPEIGRKFGGKNHSTVVHAVKNITKKMYSDRSLSGGVEALSSTLEKMIVPPF